MMCTRPSLALLLASLAAAACTTPYMEQLPLSEGALESPDGGDPGESVSAPPNGGTPVDLSVALAAGEAKALDSFVVQQMTAGRIPGVTLAIVRAGKLAYTHAYGLADKEANTPMTTQSILGIASISKTVTGVSLMQLADEKKVNIDGDVSKYLLSPLRNPRFPDTPITLRQLLTHTSSIVSNGEVLGPLFAEGADSPSSLSDLTAQYFYEGGSHYSLNNFGTTAPGSTTTYCNVCLALVGYVIERVSGSPFQTYTKDKIFAPLGMTSTTWLLADTEKSRLATPYSVDPQSNLQQRAPHLGLPDWPAGSLKTTASDYARFLAAIASRGAAGGTRILAKTTMDEMLRIQSPLLGPDQGLIFYESARNGAKVWGHSGALDGIASVMDFVPGSGNGAVVLSNTDWPQSPTGEPALIAIEAKALELAAKQ